MWRMRAVGAVMVMFAVTVQVGVSRSDAEPQSRAVVITPAEARNFVESWWPLREKASADNDVDTGLMLEDGIARDIDVGISRDNAIRQLAGERIARGYTDLSVVVPRQTSYPASFLAEALTTDYPTNSSGAVRPVIEVMIFTRRSATRPWKLSFVSHATEVEGASGARGVTGADLHQPVHPDPDGFAQARIPVAWTDPAAQLQQLAGYWQHWMDTKTAPAQSDWAPGYWTTVRGAAIAENPGRNEACDCAERVRYVVRPKDKIWVFPVADARTANNEAAMVCGTIHVERTDTPDRGYVLTQDRGYENWGAYLDPGRYRRLLIDDTREPCLLVDPGGPPVRVVGGNGWTVAIHGSR